MKYDMQIRRAGDVVWSTTNNTTDGDGDSALTAHHYGLAAGQAAERRAVRDTVRIGWLSKRKPIRPPP